MSTLRTNNLQNPDSSNVNIELTQNGGAVVSGIVTASAGIEGNLTGNVTGNLIGNVTGNLIGNVTGQISGIQTSIQVGDTFIKPNSIAIGNTNTAGRNAGVSTATGEIIFNSTTGQTLSLEWI